MNLLRHRHGQRSRSLSAGSLVAIVFTALLACAWLSAGATPLRDAFRGARAPSDFATDFVPAARLALSRQGARVLHPDLQTGNAEAIRLGAPPYLDVGVPFGAHPPPAVLIVAALVPWGFPVAAAVWLLLSLACLALVARMAASALLAGAAAPRTRIATTTNTSAATTTTASAASTPPATSDGDEFDGRRRSAAPVGSATLLLFVVLLSWPPVLHNVEKGQWSLLVAGLLAAAWYAFARGRDRSAGAFIALAAACKVMPLVVLLAFAGAPAPRRRRIILGATATLGLAVAATTLIMGPGAWAEFIRATPLNTRGWQTAPANTLSLWGALARLLVGGPFARALPLGAPGLRLGVALALWLLIAGLLTVLVFRRARRAGGSLPGAGNDSKTINEDDEQPFAAACAGPFAAACALSVVLNPLSWSHGAVLLILPVALICGRLLRSAGIPGGAFLDPPAYPGRPLTAALASVVLLTTPRHTLLAWAGPLPVSWWGALVLATHLAAALIILALAVRLPANLPSSRA